MKKLFISNFSVLIVLLTSFSLVWTPAVSASPAMQPATCVLTGTAYRDFNADAEQGANEPGVVDIQVTAFNAAGATIATTTTAADGAYTLNVPEGVEVRVEFGGLPTYLRYGPDGDDSNTSVAFVTCDAGIPPVNIGLANPGQHCDLNPDVITSCFVLGDQQSPPNNGLDSIISAPYTAGSTDVTSGLNGRFDTPPHDSIAIANEVGSVWGLAYQRQTQTLFAGAFQKRHAGYGPEGPGAIYSINLTGGGPMLFTTLNAAPAAPIHTDGTEYADHPGVVPWVVDREAFDWVGKVGLGDLTMSDDDSTLYAVNLFDRRLYAIPVDDPGGVTSVPLPTGLPGCPAAGDARPFAVEFYDGRIYVGLTCTAESNQNPDSLRGYVYSAAPGSGSFSVELNFPLNYPRQCVDQAFTADCETNHPAEWLPWSPTMQTDYYNGTVITYPQPWVSDIEFDNNGDMIIGIRDRFGDQMGNNAFSPDVGDDNLYLAITAGDTLRACAAGAGNWTLESGASCGGITTAGSTPAGTGPGGGEYYFDDALVDRHDELSMGSLLQIPGQPAHVNTAFDPIPVGDQVFDGGFRWYDNTTGETVQAYRVYVGMQGSTEVFGKANGLGGLEAVCPPAPIEIGNRVWFDLNNNGQQDPEEAPVPGVTVRLYDADGNQVAETVTNGAGEYLFTSTANGVEFNTDYVIRLDNPADFETGGPLFEWFLTNTGVGRTEIDSDALLANGFPTIELTTGDPGDNNHTYDFGFVNQLLPTPAPTTPGTGGDDDSESPALAAQGGPPGLDIDKTVDPPFAQIGDVVTWTVTVRNNGGTAYDDLVVTDSVPDGMAIQSTTTTRGTVSVSGQQITLTIGSLGPGESVVMTIKTLISNGPNVPLIFDNTAFVLDLSDTARVIRASQLVATGETPWWRDPLIAGILTVIVGGASYAIIRRRRTVVEM